jgi:hypothetical protein
MCTKIAIGLVALWLPAGAVAQSIQREQIRYELRQRDCRDAFRQRVELNCDQACRRAAETRRERCLASAERRYVQALRVQLRPPDQR